MSDLPEKPEFLLYDGGELRSLATHKEFLSVRRAEKSGAK